MSSSYVYSGLKINKSYGINEKKFLNPVHDFGFAKKFFEEYLTKYYSNSTIFRLSNVFGEGEFIRGNTVYNMAIEAKKNNKVTIAFFGEGATNTGAFHEGVNFAAVRNSNVVFVIENNQYAISVPRELSDKLMDLSIRAQSYGIPGVTVDGNDILKVYGEVNKAVKRARNGKGPSLVEFKTYRRHGHHAGEPNDGLLYRSKKEMEGWKKKDPIKRLQKELLDKKIIDKKTITMINEKLNIDFENAIKFAEESPLPEKEALFEDVYIKENLK